MGTSAQMSTSNRRVKYTISITQNWQDIGSNCTNVTVSVYFWETSSVYDTVGSGTIYCKIDGTTYSAAVSPSQKITSFGIILFKKSVNISHNPDGSKYLGTSAWIELPQVLSSSEQGYGEWLSAIPLGSAVSGGSGNIGSTSTISINRANTGFTHKLFFSFGTISWREIATDVATSYTWTLPDDLYAQIPNSNSGTGTIYCETYSENIYIGYSFTNFTANVVDSNPIFSAEDISYKDINSSIVEITGDDQEIVRNKSSLSVNFAPAIAQNSSTIAKYQVTFNGSTSERTSSGTINYGLVNSGNSLILSIKVIDSRGNFTTATKTVNILDWQNPTASIIANRKNNCEDTTYLKVIASISSVNSKNAIQTVRYRYKQTSSRYYSSYIEISNNTQYTLTFSTLNAWNLQVEITDKFGSMTYGLSIAKGIPIMFFDTEKMSVGINRLPVNQGSFETNDIYMNGKTLFDLMYPIGSIYLSTNSLNPANYFGGTWVAWGQGRVPVGVSTSGTFNGVEKTGGAETHTLTETQIPAHAGHVPNATYSWGAAGENTYMFPTSSGYQTGTNRPFVARAGNELCIRSNTAGGGLSHNNLQPYITCYMWKRTA